MHKEIERFFSTKHRYSCHHKYDKFIVQQCTAKKSGNYHRKINVWHMTDIILI